MTTKRYCERQERFRSMDQEIKKKIERERKLRPENRKVIGRRQERGKDKLLFLYLVHRTFRLF